MANRFFWLPWLSPLAGAVGPRTKMDSSPWDPIVTSVGWPTQNGNANLFRYVDLDTVMPVYSVTTDAARVPLIQSKLYATAALVTAKVNWPRKPAWSYSSVNCACIDPGGDPGVYPQYGPWYWAMALQPWAKFVYELNGTSQITGADFFSTSGSNPRNCWLIGRKYAGSRYVLSGPSYVDSFTSHGLSPLAAYVYRPSTGQIVGWLYQRYTRGGAGPHYGNYGAGVTARSSPYDAPGPENQTYLGGLISTLGNCYWGGSGYNVTGIQNGDLLVWEWWVSTYMGCGINIQYGPQDVVYSTIETTLGGGLSGQPLTLDGSSKPNWAPAWGMPTNPAINGKEPDPPRQSMCSVGF